LEQPPDPPPAPAPHSVNASDAGPTTEPAPRRAPLGDAALLASLTFVVGATAAVVASIVVSIVFVTLSATGALGDAPSASGSSRADLVAAATSFPALLSTIVVSQAAMLGTALCAWWLTKTPLRHRLGLVRPSVSGVEGTVIVLASGVPFAISLAAASVMPSISDPEQLLGIWRDTAPLAAIVWIATIGLLPGVIEEVLFRGMIQRGFMRSMRPLAAILLTSVLFGLLHIDPPAVALAFILGLWLGIVAWRTSSIVLTIIIHAVINASWNAGQTLVRQTEPDESVVLFVVGAIAAVSLVAFVWSIAILRRTGASRAGTV
jgi:membrane protease YdiL (CAAX protease family)